MSLYSTRTLTESTVSALGETSSVETSIVKQTASGEIVVAVVISLVVTISVVGSGCSVVVANSQKSPSYKRVKNTKKNTTQSF